jgi:hypothetical protein
MENIALDYPNSRVWAVWAVWGIDVPIYFWSVVSTPLKNMKVSWGDYSQYMEKQRSSKPPTRFQS